MFSKFWRLRYPTTTILRRNEFSAWGEKIKCGKNASYVPFSGSFWHFRPILAQIALRLRTNVMFSKFWRLRYPTTTILRHNEFLEGGEKIKCGKNKAISGCFLHFRSFFANVALCQRCNDTFLQFWRLPYLTASYLRHNELLEWWNDLYLLHKSSVLACFRLIFIISGLFLWLMPNAHGVMTSFWCFEAYLTPKP